MRLPENKVFVPSVIQDGKLIMRGTEEWDEREAARQRDGCCCVSYGPVMASIMSSGRSAMYRDYHHIVDKRPWRA